MVVKRMNTVRRYIYMRKAIYFFMLLFTICSCKESDRGRILQLVKEWKNKEIVFPENIVYTIYGKDTIDYVTTKTSYTIVSYIDSVGCTSCRLQLFRWREYITEQDSLSLGNVTYKFIFHPKDIKELSSLLRKDNFDFPVWIDNEDSFNGMNELPSEHAFHTFLLDDENRVVVIGDPIQNPKIKELYQRMICGKENRKADAINTTVNIDKLVLDFGEFDWREPQKAIFTLQNTGKQILVINDVVTSCGCIKVEYSHEPVRPGNQLDMMVTYKADYPEYTNKSLKIYANIDSSPLDLRVKGEARIEK